MGEWVERVCSEGVLTGWVDRVGVDRVCVDKVC